MVETLFRPGCWGTPCMCPLFAGNGGAAGMGARAFLPLDGNQINRRDVRVTQSDPLTTIFVGRNIICTGKGK